MRNHTDFSVFVYMVKSFGRRARYVVVEGCDGVGKSTQIDKLEAFLTQNGFKVLKTKEPGTPLAPLTMELRGIMLDAGKEKDITKIGRELISQTIRSIHLEKVIYPALDRYDFIIQDRGLLSALSYGVACGIELDVLKQLSEVVVASGKKYGVVSPYSLYDKIVYLRTDKVNESFARARGAKQEFEKGDAMENQGSSFNIEVASNFEKFAPLFNKVGAVNVTDLGIDEVFKKVASACLGLDEPIEE